MHGGVARVVPKLAPPPPPLTLSPVKECAGSSPTSYFWFRKALDITNSIDESGKFNPIMTGCLLAAWAIVALGMIKGIKSSARVKPYQLLFIIIDITILSQISYFRTIKSQKNVKGSYCRTM